jgi:hypothetical protein
MKVLFEYLVDFVQFPLSLPTIENCRKCAFYHTRVKGGCVKTDARLCQFGRGGYFVKNYMREVVDAGSPGDDLTTFSEIHNKDRF